MAGSVCPACGSTEPPSRRLLSDLAIATCRACELVISDIRSSRAAGTEYSKIDADRYRRSIGAVRRHQAMSIVAHATGFVQQGRWLDVGAGFGYAVAEARRAGFEVSGVEPDARAAEAAHVQHGTLDDVSGVFDVISTLDVLEHAPDLKGFAAKVSGKLHANGLWIVKVPTTEGLFYRAGHALIPVGRPLVARFVRRLWQCDEEYPHLVYFNRSSLRGFLEANGFAVLHTSYLAEVPNATAVDRLSVDGSIPRWAARLAAPAIYAINAIETLRGRTDALLVIARRM